MANRGQDPGRLVGEVYASNTVGAIIRSIGFADSRYPATRFAGPCERLLIAPGSDRRQHSNRQERNSRWAAAAAIVLVWAVPPIPWKLIGFGRRLPSTTGRWDLVYVGEGMNSSIALFEVGRHTSLLPRQRQGRGKRRTSGHAPPATPRAPPSPATQEPAKHSGSRLWSRSHRRHVRRASGSPAHHHLRDRAPDSAPYSRSLRERESQRDPRPAHKNRSTTTRASLRPHDSPILPSTTSSPPTQSTPG